MLDKMIEINVKAAVRLVHRVVPKMIERVRTEVDGVRLDRYVRFEARLGRPFWAREEREPVPANAAAS